MFSVFQPSLNMWQSLANFSSRWMTSLFIPNTRKTKQNKTNKKNPCSSSPFSCNFLDSSPSHLLLGLLEETSICLFPTLPSSRVPSTTQLLSWPKDSFKFFHEMSRKYPSEPFGQLNILLFMDPLYFSWQYIPSVFPRIQCVWKKKLSWSVKLSKH